MDILNEENKKRALEYLKHFNPNRKVLFYNKTYPSQTVWSYGALIAAVEAESDVGKEFIELCNR